MSERDVREDAASFCCWAVASGVTFSRSRSLPDPAGFEGIGTELGALWAKYGRGGWLPIALAGGWYAIKRAIPGGRQPETGGQDAGVDDADADGDDDDYPDYEVTNND